VLSDGEVLIKVEYSAVNRADVHQRTGNYPPPPGTTDVLGLECVGRIVVEGANTAEEKLGNRVMALLPGGGYAQYVKVHASNTIPVPDSVSSQDAACFTEVWATAYQLLFYIGSAKPGETVLVHAAASGVGTALI
jgi:tumor protein p53-inducible protein 3